MSALARMAEDEHRSVKLKKGDTVILSSTPVPGNEKTVSHVINKLYEKEINVIYNDVADIHVSGHASQEDLKLMHSLVTLCSRKDRNPDRIIMSVFSAERQMPATGSLCIVHPARMALPSVKHTEQASDISDSLISIRQRRKSRRC